MSFAQPSYLWALLGLLVPIAIHLWSKQEAKTIKIGSVQLLSESKSKQSSSIQLNEWWLLLLRMSIVSLLVLLLAKPQWQTKVKNSELTYIMEPELVRNENFMSRFNALNESQELRLLKKDLPVRNEEEQIAKTSAVQDYWALASEMDGLNTDSIVVFTMGFASGLKGARPETKKKINWIVMDSALPKEYPLLAYKKNDGLQLYTGWSTPDATKIDSKTITLGEEFVLSSGGDSLLISRFNPAQKVPVVNQNTIEVSLFYSDSLRVDKTYLEASLKALSMYLDREIKVASQLDTEIDEDKEADVIIWLSAKPHPETTQKLLVWKEDTKAQSIIIAGEDDNIYYLTKRINPENAVYERLTEELLEVLNVNQEVEELLAEVDHRSVTTSELETMYVANDKKEKQLASWNVNPYLWLMLLILLMVERFVAYKRKQ